MVKWFELFPGGCAPGFAERFGQGAPAMPVAGNYSAFNKKVSSRRTLAREFKKTFFINSHEIALIARGGNRFKIWPGSLLAGVHFLIYPEIARNIPK